MFPKQRVVVWEIAFVYWRFLGALEREISHGSAFADGDDYSRRVGVIERYLQPQVEAIIPFTEQTL
jgi:hypothetical protein